MSAVLNRIRLFKLIKWISLPSGSVCLFVLQWIPVLQDFRNKDTLWGFVPYQNDKSSTEISFPITLHIGDYNMDGYPDALAILKNTSGR